MSDEIADTTPEFDYQAAPEVPEATTPSDPTQAYSTDAHERQAFAAYVKDQGGKIPSNFKDAGAWFDSLKNAQKEFTQAKQEIASLKTKYSQSEANPDYKPEVPAATKEPPKAPEQKLPEELRIPDAPVTEAAPPVTPGVTEDDWKNWTVEYSKMGTLSDETQNTIRQKTNLPDYVIAQYMEGQKAKIEIAYSKASNIIGGKDKLNTLFTWASKTLSKTEQENMNASLASANWEIALLGLNAKYDKVHASNKTGEPVAMPTNTKVASANTNQTLIGYRTKREFAADRNNPRFEHDPKYRSAVEQRMMKTDFNKLQA